VKRRRKRERLQPLHVPAAATATSAVAANTRRQPREKSQRSRKIKR